MILLYFGYSKLHTGYTIYFYLGTFDVQTANYSLNSVGVVCVECELVSETAAQGCHVTLDCGHGDVIEQDFFRSDLISASGCFLSEATTTTFCTLLIYDIEEDGSVSSNPALTFDDVLVSGMVLSITQSSSSTTMVMATTSTPSESGKE